MASLNKVFLIGNLGRDPETRFTPGGQVVCNFTLATNERWTDKAGQKQEKTEWHRIVVWGRQAEVCKNYLSKGRQVFVEGSLQTRDWNDRDGNKRQTTEIRAFRIQMLGGRGGRTEEVEGGAEPEAAGAGEESDPEYSDEDIPF